MLPPPSTAPTPRPEAQAPGTARWLNLVTTTVLGAVVLVVVVAAMPSLLRAGLQASDGLEELPPPVRGRRPALVPRDHPPHAFPQDEPRGARPVVPFDDEPPGALHPNDPRASAPRLPRQDREDDEEPGTGIQSRVVLRTLPLRERRTGTVIGEVKAGQSVMVLREDGEWLLVVQSPDASVSGWAKRSELLLR